MIPLYDDNPTRRRPVVTVALLVAMGAVWVVVQGAGLDPVALASSVCDWGPRLAFWAHVGGFAAGLLMTPLFVRRELVGGSIFRQWMHAPESR